MEKFYAVAVVVVVLFRLLVVVFVASPVTRIRLNDVRWLCGFVILFLVLNHVHSLFPSLSLLFV